MISGLLVVGIGAGWVFAIDARHVRPLQRLARTARPAARVVKAQRAVCSASLRSGWMEVRSRAWVWMSVARFSVSNLAIAPLLVLRPLVAKESLGGATSWG